MGQIWSEPNSKLSALVQVYSNLNVQTIGGVLMHNYCFIHACLFFLWQQCLQRCCCNIACLLCWSRMLLLSSSVCTSLYNSWRLLFTCVNIKVFRTDGFFCLPFTNMNAVPLVFCFTSPGCCLDGKPCSVKLHY